MFIKYVMPAKAGMTIWGNVKQVFLLLFCSLFIQTSLAQSQKSYSLLDEKQYRQVVAASRARVQALLSALQKVHTQSQDHKVAFIAKELADIPYLYQGAMGEGDWQTSALQYKPGAVHIQQNPVYRLDGLDCQTFVQVAMALLYSNSLAQFDQHIVKISYGAAGSGAGEWLHFYNRNHFMDGDFNPINERNGFLSDVTSLGRLGPFKTASANITRQKWFAFKKYHLRETVSVLNNQDGPKMVNHFLTHYSNLKLPRFTVEKVTISYIPKETLVRYENGDFHPNNFLFDKIPTPALAEIIYDIKKWYRQGKKIKDQIGTELNVAHAGLLYRQTFHYGELIYHKITCDNIRHKKQCQVRAILCQKSTCKVFMFVHATKGYPRNYNWYSLGDGGYTCSAKQPSKSTYISQCNRVEHIPLFDYLTQPRYGNASHIQNKAFVGIHIERLIIPATEQEN